MVLDADEIQAEGVGADGELTGFSYLGRVRDEAEAELDRPAVVTHSRR
jgi:hypothetical protein